MPVFVRCPGTSTADPGPADTHAISEAPTAITAFVGPAALGPVHTPVPITGVDAFARTFGDLDPAVPLGYAVHDFFRNGGQQAIVVRLPRGSAPLGPADYAGNAADGSGLHALDGLGTVNLLCLSADTRRGDVPDGAYREAAAYCAGRRAVLIVDAKAAWTTASAARAGLVDLALSGDDARNAALYFPRVLQADPALGGQIDTFAPAGLVAGVIARTDRQHGPWKAPAGVDAVLDGIVGPGLALNGADQDVLNRLGVNCLRTVPPLGCVVWGARTMRGSDVEADEYKYLPVRRMALHIEHSICRGLAWTSAAPNDEPLWSEIRLTVGAFLHDLFRRGAFQGRTAREAYFVRCDRDTTTQADVDNGVVNVAVGFAPLKPAEFVVLTLQQIAARPVP